MGQDLDWRDKYLWRIFGIRDLLLAVGVLTSSGRERQRWIAASMIGDLSDAAASVIGGRKAGLSVREQLMHSMPGVLGATFGALALRDVTPSVRRRLSGRGCSRIARRLR